VLDGEHSSSLSTDRPEPRRLALLGQQLEVERRWARNQLWPALDVGVSVGKDFGAGSPTRSPWQLDVFATLEIPVLPRLALSRIAAVDASLERTRALERQAHDRVAADVADAVSQLRTARERAAIAEREVELAFELERAELARYALGDSNLVYVNLREQATAEARLRHVDALSDFQRAQVVLRAARGIAL